MNHDNNHEYEENPEFYESINSEYRPDENESNARIVARNGGIRHQFIDDIGGCSANYR
jgi:hypothetical protein